MSSITISSKPLSEKQRFWVVRSGKDAVYYNHFRYNNVVAIGHTKDINFDFEGELSPEDIKTILDSYESSLKQKDEAKSFISRQVGQVRQFVTHVKEGDTVLTITDSKVLAGRVTSPCYYDETGLEAPLDEDSGSCYYPLRIKVEWGQVQAREYIPYVIDKSFRNTGTIFSISDEDKVKVLNHWLYPIHFTEDEVRCSIKIGSQESLSNRGLSNLSIVCDKLEILAAYISSLDDLEDSSPEEFESFLSEHELTYKYRLTAQHAFMSPGHQFIQLKGTKSERIAFALAFSFLLNTGVSFAEEGENNEKKIEVVASLMPVVKTSGVEDSIKSLKAEMPNKIVKDVEFEEPVPSKDAML